MAPGACRRWCFTLNNYTEENVEYIKNWLTEKTCKYAIVAREVGDKTNTPHLQGFFNLRRRLRLTALTKKLKAHYEKALGTDGENEQYCKKGGDILLEIGKPVDVGITKLFLHAKELADKLSEGGNLSVLLDESQEYVAAYARYGSFVDKVADVRCQFLHKQRFIKRHLDKHLVMYEWQVRLYDILLEEPDDRTIFWIVDNVGGAGKSTFVNYYSARHDSIVFSGGKIEHLAYSYGRERVVFFDLSMEGEWNYLYRFMEQLKNGRVFSSKYKSVMKYFDPPHVVVFSNHLWATGGFSLDRMRLLVIHENKFIKDKVCLQSDVSGLLWRGRMENARH